MSAPTPLSVITTADGSTTLQQADTGWTYRSVHGAAQESRQVFVEASRVLQRGLSQPSILEMGFGAAGNFAATLRAFETASADALHYCAVDRAPVPAPMLCPDDARARMLAAEATAHTRARQGAVSLELHHCDFVELDVRESFDAIYFDPFGPTQQPDSWRAEVFAAIRPRLAQGGRLTTYAAAGWVRRNLAAAGFFVATAPGPAGKRHITVAARSEDALHPLRIRNRP